MNPLQMTQLLANLQSNPMQFLSGKGFNVPSGLQSPEQIVRHLVSSGQVNQNAINQAMQMARSMGIRV